MATAQKERPGDARPSVDVVINNFNYAPFLHAAIDSALGQTYDRTRVIVVDDGSTDESAGIIGSYGDRIEAVFKPNGGQASAMNAGAAHLRGEVVMFLDADDALEPGATERVAREFAAHPGVARVHYRLRVMDAAGRPTGETKPPHRLGLAQGDLVASTLRTPFDAPWLPTSGNAFSVAALRRILPVPEEDYRLCADWYLVHVSSLLGPIGAIDEPLARYRMHGGNGFSRDGSDIDLRHLADTVHYAERTRHHLSRTAHRMRIAQGSAPMASMCDVANRVVLLRESLGVAGDTRMSLLRLGTRACVARRDVGIAMKGMFLGWLATTLVSPRPLARRLGELFLLPERREGINAVLGALHRS